MKYTKKDLQRFYDLPHQIEYFQYEVNERLEELESGTCYNEIYTELWLDYYANKRDEAIEELNTFIKEYLLA